MTLELHFWPSSFASPYFGHKHKVRVATSNVFHVLPSFLYILSLKFEMFHANHLNIN